MDYELEVVFTYPMRESTVEVVYLRYAGGGEGWEFRVFENGALRHQSESGYGNPYAAARDGFGWLAENGELGFLASNTSKGAGQ